MYVSGHSYGASVPSLEMQRLQRLHSPAQRRREEFILLATLVFESVHPDNLGALPPSPQVIVAKGCQLGLISGKDDVFLAGF